MITYHIDQAAGIVVCRALGGIGVMDVAHYLQQLQGDPDFNRNLNALIIVSDLGSLPAFAMLRYLNPVLAAWTAWRGSTHWAIVLPNIAARTMAETALKHISLHHVEARCFTSERDARRWLSENQLFPPKTVATNSNAA